MDYSPKEHEIGEGITSRKDMAFAQQAYLLRDVCSGQIFRTG